MFGAYNKRSWYRLIADIKDASIPQQPMPSNSFKIIKDCLEEFKTTTREGISFIFIIYASFAGRVYFSNNFTISG